MNLPQKKASARCTTLHPDPKTNMTPKFLVAACAATAALDTTPSAQAGFTDDFLQTLPGGYHAASGEGWLSQQVDGFKNVLSDGRTGLILPLYTNHPTWDYDNRHEENGAPFGGGLVRSVLDERGNERMVYAIAFSDSHYSVEPFLGYAWLGRWNLDANADLHVGAGYLLGLTFREDYHWYPIPAPLPLINAGYKNLDFYMTYIPVSNVFFFFSRVQTDDRNSRDLPLPEASNFRARTELYGAGLWERTDSATERGFMVTSDAGALVGLRRFVTDHWAVGLEASRAEHDTHGAGYDTHAWKLTQYAATVQYHFYPSHTWRLHAGAGVGYATLKGKDVDEKSTSVHPTVQTGVTWAPTAHTRIVGGINLYFPRFDDVAPADDVKFQPAPAQFYLGAGFAF